MIYELHIGTFTAGGTFDSAIEKLDYLVDLGVDFVELMPVNAFGGTHGWGYDGVLWYAVHETVRRARRTGPARRRLPRPRARRADRRGVQPPRPVGQLPAAVRPVPVRGQQPVGRGVNIADADADEVRRYILDCALRWMRDFHADGLRLDAVHALVDTTAIHILEELSAETDALAAQLGRPLSLIAESDLNDPRLITPRDRGGYGMTAQWDDDIHHAIHTAVSGERQGYYADFGSLETLATTLKHGYFHAGTYSSFRHRRHGRPLDTATIPATRLLAYTSDPRPGRQPRDRRPAVAEPGLRPARGQGGAGARIALHRNAVHGRGVGVVEPVPVLHLPPRAGTGRATAEGRKAEFAEHGWDADEIPDPQDPETFQRSKLNWDEVDAGDHARLLELYRGLIALRHDEPDLADPWLDHMRDRLRRGAALDRDAPRRASRSPATSASDR